MYSVSDASLIGDRGSILRLWSENFLHATEARYDWLYKDKSLGEPVCVLLRDGAERPVGSSALLPRQVLWKGEAHVIGQAIDLAIDRAHRAAGPAIRLQRSILAHSRELGCSAVYGFPLPPAEPLLKRIGYRPLGGFRVWSKYLRSRAGLGAAGGVKRAFRLLNGRVRDAVRPLPRRMHIENDTPFDGRFDALWIDAAGQFDVLGERSGAFLEARFTRSPKGGYRRFSILAGDDRLSGYVVYEVRNEGTAKIVDALASKRPEWTPLFAAFCRHARKAGFERVQFPVLGPPWLTGRLLHLGFRPRCSRGKRANDNVLVYQGPEANPRLSGLESWLMTYADTDAD